MEFVETNVLLYAYDASGSAQSDKARSLVSAFGRSRTGALSVQVLQEFYVNAVSKIRSPQPMGANEFRTSPAGQPTCPMPMT